MNLEKAGNTRLFGVKIDTPLILFCFGILGLTGIFLCSSFQIDIFGKLFIIGIANLLIGGLLGFLFGIPRIGKNNSTYKENEKYKPNTNLEEISDWLTKIIVGLGLSQLPSLKSNFYALIVFIDNDVPMLPKFVIMMTISYFFLYGFFLSFLSTRIYLGPVFARSDENAIKKEIEKDVKNIKTNNNFLDERIDIGDDDNIDTEETIAKVRNLEKNDVRIEGEIYKKLGIKVFSNKNYGLAEEFFQKSYKIDNDISSLCNLGVVVGKYLGNYELANEYFNEAIRINKEYPLAYYNLACNKIRQGAKTEALNDLKLAIQYGGDQFLSVAQKDKALEPISRMKEFKSLIPNYNPIEGNVGKENVIKI
jgi:tetratricopeptide (TPR) repeat protein